MTDNTERPCPVCGQNRILRRYRGKRICLECWREGRKIGDRLRALAAECDLNPNFSASAAVVTRNSTLHLFCDAPQDEDEARARVMGLFERIWRDGQAELKRELGVE